MVDRAMQVHGKAKVNAAPKAPPRPQATPARAANGANLEKKMVTPEAGPTASPPPGPSPMSASSTPLKSPDAKRHRADSTTSLGLSEVPSLPSFSGSGASRPRHSDSSTTISLNQYMAEMNLGKGQTSREKISHIWNNLLNYICLSDCIARTISRPRRHHYGGGDTA